MKETEDETDGKIAHVLGLEDSILSKFYTKGIQCKPYQNTNDIFHRNKTKNFKFVWRQKRPQIAKKKLRKITRTIRLPDFRLHY